MNGPTEFSSAITRTVNNSFAQLIQRIMEYPPVANAFAFINSKVHQFRTTIVPQLLEFFENPLIVELRDAIMRLWNLYFSRCHRDLILVELTNCAAIFFLYDFSLIGSMLSVFVAPLALNMIRSIYSINGPWLYGSIVILVCAIQVLPTGHSTSLAFTLIAPQLVGDTSHLCFEYFLQNHAEGKKLASVNQAHLESSSEAFVIFFRSIAMATLSKHNRFGISYFVLLLILGVQLFRSMFRVPRNEDLKLFHDRQEPLLVLKHVLPWLLFTMVTWLHIRYFLILIVWIWNSAGPFLILPPAVENNNDQRKVLPSWYLINRFQTVGCLIMCSLSSLIAWGIGFSAHPLLDPLRLAVFIAPDFQWQRHEFALPVFLIVIAVANQFSLRICFFDLCLMAFHWWLLVGGPIHILGGTRPLCEVISPQPPPDITGVVVYFPYNGSAYPGNVVEQVEPGPQLQIRYRKTGDPAEALVEVIVPKDEVVWPWTYSDSCVIVPT